MGHLLMTSCSGRFHSGPSLLLLAFFVLLEASPPILQNGLPEPGFVRLNPDSLPCVSQFPVLGPAVSWVLNIRFPLKTEESQPLTCCPPSHRRSHCFIRTSRWISRNGAVGLSWELDACLTPPGLSALFLDDLLCAWNREAWWLVLCCDWLSSFCLVVLLGLLVYHTLSLNTSSLGRVEFYPELPAILLIR